METSPPLEHGPECGPWISRRVRVLAIALLVAFAFQGSRGLYETTEGRYAEVAREMIASGNFLEPTLGNDPHWTKPPLTYWAVAGGMELLGKNEWGVRLFNALTLVLIGAGTWHLGRSLWDERTGLLGALIIVTAPFAVAGCAIVSTDGLLTLFELLAVGGLFIPGRLGTRLFWVWLGMGFLTKGPPVLLPLVPVILWNRRQAVPKRLWDPLGLLLFTVIALSWYVTVALMNPGLASQFLGAEVVGHISGGTGHNPQWYKGLTIYAPPLVLGFGVWLIPIVTALRRRALALPSVKELALGGTPVSLLGLWVTIPLAVFMAAGSRLPLYVLPVWPPMCLGAARLILRAWPAERCRPLIARSAAMSVVLAVAAKGAAAHFPSDKNMRSLANTCREIVGPGVWAVTYERPGLYGLEFYLDGQVRRVSDVTDGHWVDGTVAGTIRHEGERDRLDQIVFVTQNVHSAELERRLTNLGFSWQEHDEGRWRLFAIASSPENASCELAGNWGG